MSLHGCQNKPRLLPCIVLTLLDFMTRMDYVQCAIQNTSLNIIQIVHGIYVFKMVKLPDKVT